MLKLVLDTCIVKLASFPAEDNPAALIVQMGLNGLFEWWVSPATATHSVAAHVGRGAIGE